MENFDILTWVIRVILSYKYEGDFTPALGVNFDFNTLI